MRMARIDSAKERVGKDQSELFIGKDGGGGFDVEEDCRFASM